MKPVFAACSMLGLAGFVASLVVHVCGLLQQSSPFGPWVWALHVGLFPPFFVLMYFANKTKPAKAGRDNFSHLMEPLPGWVGVVSRSVVAYAVLNFVAFMFQTTRYPKKGVPEWLVQRGFSGHWLIFYGAIFLGFWGLHAVQDRR